MISNMVSILKRILTDLNPEMTNYQNQLINAVRKGL